MVNYYVIISKNVFSQPFKSMRYLYFLYIIREVIPQNTSVKDKRFLAETFDLGNEEKKAVIFCILCITKTCLYNFDPLKPHFYTVKLGFTGVYIIFLISAQNIDCGYLLEPPHRGGSYEYLQSMFCAEI